MKISMLTGGGGDKYYELGLVSGLALNGVYVDLIGNDGMKDDFIIHHDKVQFFNFRGDQSPNVPIIDKITRVINYYYKLFKYVLKTDSQIFHIQWPNKFLIFDRTILNLFYKFNGKKIIFTAHNVDQLARDGGNSVFNRLSLKFMYHTVNHIIVHTENNKRQVAAWFNVEMSKISVISYGINDMVPVTKMTGTAARRYLHLHENEKTILFFGNIAPYKGLEYLIKSLDYLKESFLDYKLIIAGRVKNCPDYWKMITKSMFDLKLEEHIIKKIEFIADKEIEIYFKSADILILPYRSIFQSGLIFLAYNFGLPVIASDVGSLKEEIVEGKTGYIFRPEDPQDLAEKIITYFKSDIYKNLVSTRIEIRNFANIKYSWKVIGKNTKDLYIRFN